MFLTKEKPDVISCTVDIMDRKQANGLCGQMILTATLALALLLVGPPMSNRSCVMAQAKGGTQIGG